MVDDDKHYLGNSQTSQLCKPLSAVLRDSAPLSMLDYFVQYMETEGALHLLQFWFAIETFKNVTSIYNSPNHVKDYRPNNPIVDHQCKQCCSVSVESGVSVCNRMTSVEGSEVDNLIGEENSVTCETRNDSIPSSTLTPKTESTTRAVNGQAVERSGRGKEITQCGSSASIKGQDSATFSQAAPDGMHIQQQQRLLKQLSLSKEVCCCCVFNSQL